MDPFSWTSNWSQLRPRLQGDGVVVCITMTRHMTKFSASDWLRSEISPTSWHNIILKPPQNDRHPFGNKSTLVKVKSWCQFGDKPEILQVITHLIGAIIYITGRQGITNLKQFEMICSPAAYGWSYWSLGPLLQTWFNFNSSTDK